MAALAVVAVSVVATGARLPVAACGALATIAVALVAAEGARRGRVIAELRQQFTEREAGLNRRLTGQEAATVRLAEVLLPGAVARLQQGELAEDVLQEALFEAELDPAFTSAHRSVLHSVVEAVKAQEDIRDSGQRAFVNIARRVQAIVHQQARDLREMETRHGNDPVVFTDLLHVDHGTALIGRLADSIAVLGGARPGRQWQQSVALFSVLRGSMSRIMEHQRVELHSVAEVAVVGPAAEPLMHALAELLDNATRYSPPKTQVHLTAIEVQSGVAVEIEDGGVGLTEEARTRAERVLSQASAGIDLTDLGETPRLGLSVVGRLAQAHNFQVSLRPSAYGGVRAVLIIPQDLITVVRASAQNIPSIPAPPAAPVRAPRTTLTGPAPVEAPVETERSAGGLPQRTRRKHAAVPPVETVSAAAPAAAKSAAPTVQPGLWMAAFQQGVTDETSPDDTPRRTSDEPLDKGE